MDLLQRILLMNQSKFPPSFLPGVVKPLDELSNLLRLFLRRCSQASRAQARLWLRRRRGSRQRSGGCRWDPLRFLVLPKGEQVCRFRGHWTCINPDKTRASEQEKLHEAAGMKRNDQVTRINPSEKISMAESKTCRLRFLLQIQKRKLLRNRKMLKQQTE